MYKYRYLPEAEQKALVEQRLRAGQPWHTPPHQEHWSQTYLLTAANYEHQHFMACPERRAEFQGKLLERLMGDEANQIHAWCILPNHYHVLIQGALLEIQAVLHRLHNGTATQWNREDQTPGRKVWFRFHDRGIRNEPHFWATFNYVNANAVKHGYVQRAKLWPCCSAPQFIELYGADWMQKVWRDYPVLNYGQGWDW